MREYQGGLRFQSGGYAESPNIRGTYPEDRIATRAIAVPATMTSDEIAH